MHHLQPIPATGNHVLALDIGPNSIGWAVLDDCEAGRVIDGGVRIFPEGVDNFDTSKEFSRNEDRRVARGMRRQVLRRKRRKAILRKALTEAGLLPEDAGAMRAIVALDPLVLRAAALERRLEPFEIGRIFLHLNKRRGFQSNARKDKGDKEIKGMLAEISELQAKIGDRTLGQALAADRADPQKRIRGLHTRRSMLLDEFYRIWEFQAQYHPLLSTVALRFGRAGPRTYPSKPRRLPKASSWLAEFGIEGIIFFQRPMFWPASMVGMCELEHGEKRSAKADRAAQRFRMLQEVNNLRFFDPDAHQEKSLDSGQRALLLERLAVKEKMTFSDLRKALGFLESVTFSHEKGERSHLKGHQTDVAINKAAKGWHDRPEEERDAIAGLLIDPKLDDDSLIQRLSAEHGFSNEQAAALAAVQLPTGYLSVSRKAVRKLLPYLEQGMRYMADSDPAHSALHAAGYLRRDEMQRRLFAKLPSLTFVHTGPLADLPNPVVRTALYELRKVVNAVVNRYGKPAAVHVEMARELKMNEEKRRNFNQRRQARENERSDVAKELRDAGVTVSRGNITRVLLWKQQGGICIYSGRSISYSQLFDGEVDEDHILPYSRTLDDSQGNKVVCYRIENAAKGDKTPYEWLAADPPRYEAICQRARSLPYSMFRKFILKELELDEFIARQLRDTSYMTKLALEYLRMLVGEHQVLAIKGGLTAELRHQWGLDDVLAEIHNSPAWEAEQSGALRPGEKNRADHRHHAIDAIVVGLMNRSRLQKLSRMKEAGGVRVTGEALPDPWPGFRHEVVARVKTINVSHRVRRKVAGKLHEETAYGQTRNHKSGNIIPGVFVVRKPIEALSESEVERIRDPIVREIVAKAFRDAGRATGRKKRGAAVASAGTPTADLKTALANLHMPGPNGTKGPPIKRVRVLKNEETIQPIRMLQAQRSGDPTQIAFVKPGSTHHLTIFQWEENGKRRRDAQFVTMIEAARRIRAREPIIERNHPSRPDAKFLMSLSEGEMVLATVRGEQKLLKYRTAASTTGQMWFAAHTDARRSADYAKFTFNCNTLDARKVTVNPLGQIRWAND